MMQTARVDGAFGVIVSDVDPAQIDPADGAALRALLLEHRVLVFRDVQMTPRQHVDFMAHFGRVMVEVEDAATLADPARVGGRVAYVTTRPGEYISGRDALGFHADFSWSADGAGSVFSLYALEAEREDPTIFADMGRALRNLPDTLAGPLRTLDLVKCVNFFHNNSEDYGLRYRLSHRDPAKDYGPTISVHPAILRHPRSGEELLNLCQSFTSHVKGWSYADSERLFAAVEPHQYAEENLYHHKWRPRDLVVWDNIMLQHGRKPVSSGAARHLQRVICNPWDFSQLLERTGRRDDLAELEAAE